MPVPDTIQSIRDCTCAILRVIKDETETEVADEREVEVGLAFTGSGVCIVDDELILTAHHVLNNGEERDPNDDFYVFCVPDNERRAYHYPVIDFPLELGDRDVAVLRLGNPSGEQAELSAATLAADGFRDGTSVVTCGFPSPEIGGAQFDQDLNFRRGDFFLKSHASTGIIAAQYEVPEGPYFEFNVGWHHGESGGPVVVADSGEVISLMKGYRNIETPHGVVQGPNIGPELRDLSVRLEQLGATFE